MAAQVGISNGASQQKPAVDTAVVNLAQQLSKLRADIAAGRHARFRVPEHLAHSILSTGGVSIATSSAPSLLNGTNAKAVALDHVPAAYTTNATNMQHVLHSEPLRVSLNAHDPQAVLQQRRKELERVLEEQVQHKKLMSRQKTCDQEIIADFDVSEVLRKAHELVKPWRLTSDPNAANVDASSSDSFDENTFYSSQMDESITTEEADPNKNWKRPLRACRYFRDGKPCPYGDGCTFSHDPAVVKKIELEEQQRAGAKQARGNGQANQRAPSPPHKAPNPRADASAPDSQAARITELEEQLRQMKEQQRSTKPTVVPRAIERPDPEPSNDVDEFGRDRSKREQYREDPPQVQSVQVVRNHTTSPYVPQPSRVSPLTGAKPQASRIQHIRYEDIALSNTPDAVIRNSRQSPVATSQPVSNRKRRRGGNAEENSRNVIARRENMSSPEIRIKEEPVSPPSYNRVPRPGQLRDLPAPIHSAASSRSRDPLLQSGNDGAYVFHTPVQEKRPTTPSRRVLSRNGQQYLAQENTGLRKVVSTRNLRGPPSPGYDTPYLEPQPRVRAASQVQYVTAPEQQPPMQYRASVQPAVRERPSQPRQIELASDLPPPMNMPPPARRIVVDQFGNRYVEAPAPMIPEPPMTAAAVQRRLQYEPQYEEISPGGHIVRRAQPAMFEEEPRYVQRIGTPTSPQYVEYPSSAKKRQVIRLDQNGYEQEQYGESPRVVRYEPRTDIRYEDANGTSGKQVRAERIQQRDDQFDMIPRGQASRMSSVRPQPRLVRLGEHGETSPRAMRRVSPRPEDEYAQPVQRAQEPMYQYAPQQDGQGHYMQTSQQDAVYGQQRAGSRRIVRV